MLLLLQILTEPEHLKHFDALINVQEQYCAKATQNNLCAQARQMLHYDKKHNTNFIFKVGDKVLMDEAQNGSQFIETIAWRLHHSKRPGQG